MALPSGFERGEISFASAQEKGVEQAVAVEQVVAYAVAYGRTAAAAGPGMASHSRRALC